MRNPSLNSDFYLDDLDDLTARSDHKPRHWLSIRPSTRAAFLIFGGLGAAVIVNALYLQDMKHAAPLFGPTTYLTPPASSAAIAPGLTMAPSAPLPHATAVSAPPSPSPRAHHAEEVSVTAASAPTTGPTSKPQITHNISDIHGSSDLIAREIARLNNPQTTTSTLQDRARPEPALHSASLTAAANPAKRIVNRSQDQEKSPAVKPDAISALLGGRVSHAAPESSAALLSAQRALIKLGYVVQPNGVMDETTHSALEQFADDNDLSNQGGLNVRVKQELSRQSGLSIQ